eukprot:6972541-Ditylum_brightwellii.AAC.1
MQQLFASMRKLANTPAVVQKVMAGKPLDPAPFVPMYNAASDLVRAINVSTQLGSLQQIIAGPSSLYVAPAAAPDIPPTKHLNVVPTETKESENQRKKKQAQKESWLKKTGRGGFRTVRLPK